MLKTKFSPAALAGCLASLMLLIAGSHPAAAQQLPNPAFDNWGDCIPWTSNGKGKVHGTQPAGWTISHVIGINGTGKTSVGEQVIQGDYNAVKLINNPNPFMATQIVPGYLTLGISWSTAIGLEVAGGNLSNNDGGTFGGIEFSEKPDAVSFKYIFAREGENEEPATVVAYLWNGTFQQKDVPGNIGLFSSQLKKVSMMDRDRNILGLATAKGGDVTETGELIAYIGDKDNGYIINDVNDALKELTIPFNYISEAAPEKINVIFAANNYFGEASNIKKGNSLTVADPKLVYYSRLENLAVRGMTISDFAWDKYKYFVTELPNPDDVSFVAKESKSGVTTSDVAELVGNEVHVWVKNNVGTDIDGLQQHTYVFKLPGEYSVEIENMNGEITEGDECVLKANILAKTGTVDLDEIKRYIWTVKDENGMSVEGTVSNGGAEYTFVPSTPGDYVAVVEVETVTGNLFDAETEITVAYSASVESKYYGAIKLTNQGGDEYVAQGVTLSILTTSSSKCKLILPEFRYHGMRFKNVAISNVNYSGDETTGYTLSGDKAPVSLTGIEGVAKISGKASTDNVDILAELTIDWGEEIETATAIFTTEPIEEPEPTGAITYFPGSITMNILDRNGETTKTFDLNMTLAIVETTKRPDSGTYPVTVRIPEMHFDEVEWMDGSQAVGGTGEYYFNIPSFTVKDVDATVSGSTISYSLPKENVAVEGVFADGTKATYYLTLSGSSNADGIMRMSIVFKNATDNTEINGQFSNTEAKGSAYDGILTIEMNGMDMTGGGKQAILEIIPSADGKTATMILPDLKLDGIGNLGSIVVENVEVASWEDNTRDYTATVKGMKLMGGSIIADVDLEGFVDADGVADMVISVVWEGINIDVHFIGELTSSGVEAPVTDGDAAYGEPEYYTLGGIRVAGGNLTPGIYIVRSGSKVSKILVR